MIKKLFYVLFDRRDDAFVSDFAKMLFENKQGKGEGKVLIDCTHFLYKKWNIKNMLIANSIKSRKRAPEIHAFLPSKLFLWTSIKVYLLLTIALLLRKEVKSSYDCGCDTLRRVGLFGRGAYGCMLKAIEIKKLIKDKDDVLGIRLNGVNIGDLVYDTYLKWFRRETVNINSLGLFYVIVMAVIYEERIRELFATEGYSEIYLTHSVYIGFGIPARVGLSLGARVFVTQNTRGAFIRELSKKHPYQTPRFDLYSRNFSLMPAPEQNNALVLAEKGLESRISGQIDESIGYMRKSAYHNEKKKPIRINDYFPGRPRVLVMLHCFFDSPHIYRWMLFPDFSEWLSFVLSACFENKINVVIKAHPNGMKGNEKVIKKFKRKYSFAQYIESSVSNRDLVGCGGFYAALTVYGTVAHEFAYLDMPVINAGDNPHVSFSFSKTARSKHELKDIILSLSKGERWKISKSEIEAFYYMNYIHNECLRIDKFNNIIGPGYSIGDRYISILSDEKITTFHIFSSQINEYIEKREK